MSFVINLKLLEKAKNCSKVPNYLSFITEKSGSHFFRRHYIVTKTNIIITEIASFWRFLQVFGEETLKDQKNFVAKGVDLKIHWRSKNAWNWLEAGSSTGIGVQETSSVKFQIHLIFAMVGMGSTTIMVSLKTWKKRIKICHFHFFHRLSDAKFLKNTLKKFTLFFSSNQSCKQLKRAKPLRFNEFFSPIF